MSTTITRDDWLKALDDAGITGENDESALTVNEYAEMMGVSRCTAFSQLQRLVRLGKAAKTYKMGTTSYGRNIRYIAFRLT